MIDIDQLPRWALRMQPLVGSLLEDGTHGPEVQLLERPVGWDDFLKDWEALFRSAGNALRPVLKACQDILDALWEAHGAACVVSSYGAVERWLRSETLTVWSYAPQVTLKTWLFATAVHNWLWWQRRAKPSGEDAVAGTRLEEDLKRDVDHFLDLLEAPSDRPGDSSLRMGDLVAMHLMALTLGRWWQAGAGQLPRELRARLVRFQTTSPISRLAAIGTEERPYLSSDLTGTWWGLETLLVDPAGIGLRQYLASSLGTHAVPRPIAESDSRVAQDAGTPPVAAAVREVLAVVGVLQRLADADSNRLVFREGFRVFLAHVLRATFCGGSERDVQRVWPCWSCGFPQQISLAEWCGRLARWAETRAAARRSAIPQELEWLWQDLARVTLPRWQAGEDEAVLCWGLWIRGYLDDPDKASRPPPLVLARQACRQPLPEFVSSWHIAATRALGRTGVRGGDSQLRERLAQVWEMLEALAVYKTLLREEFGSAAEFAPAEGRRTAAAGSEQEPRPINPGVQAWRS